MSCYIEHLTPDGQPCTKPEIQSTLRGCIEADRFEGNRHSCYNCGQLFSPAEMRERFPEEPSERDERRHREWLDFLGMTQAEYDTATDFPENHPLDLVLEVRLMQFASPLPDIFQWERQMREAMGLPLIVMKTQKG